MAIGLAQNVAQDSTAASFTIPFTSPNAGGGVLTLELGVTTRGAASTVTDSAGNDWHRVSQTPAGSVSEPLTAMWYVTNANGGTNTVTVTSISSGVNVNYALQEWSGLSTSAPAQWEFTSAQSSGTSHPAGPITYNQTNVVVISAYTFLTAYDVATPPAGYTELSVGPRMASYYRILGSSGTENPDCGTVSSEQSANCMVIFAADDTGAPPAVSYRRVGMTTLGAS